MFWLFAGSILLFLSAVAIAALLVHLYGCWTNPWLDDGTPDPDHLDDPYRREDDWRDPF